MTSAYLITIFLSLMVASAELVTKFKDEPFAILTKNITAWFYILFNILIASISLYLLTKTGFFGNTEYDQIKAAFTAGFGSTILMRSKFFKVRINGKEAAIGPEIIINIFLETLEKMIDRDRALERKNIVEKYMADIDFDKTKDYVVTTIIASLQNASPETTRKLMDDTDKIAISSMGDIEKSFALGYLILDIMGEKFLKGLFYNKERFIR
ncbi:MAG: hypothetical protein A3G93_08840 [Nitrospinae bacterium RIFCSPLOWO2_12_FULL_45_22]|nr:MAG: hypothetical protein A3G93_08840 [Nitrospinae bacterium RIFCSPLOWO2_12_FULL_45_22]